MLRAQLIRSATWSFKFLCLWGLVLTQEVSAQAAEGDKPWYRISAQAELGALAVLSHKVQFGENGTYFNYVRQGGQDNLFFVSRFSAELNISQRHSVVFLYQPLELATRAQLDRELRVDEARFPEGSGVNFRYGFPFYRVSYLYDVLADERRELAFGVSAQIRNATIEFEEVGGTRFKSYRNIGFVPLLKARGSYTWPSGEFLGFEVDGIYAPIQGANGSDNEITGALLDASIRAGVTWLDRSRLFVNLRYIAGGSTGQGDPEAFTDGYAKNWLHAMTLSLGAEISGP
ncbi:MAG TPA: hypothetical protein VMF89_33985 [Polyangiales bacterium]|nr:hypothetical protein [Polyangiales bacterium]